MKNTCKKFSLTIAAALVAAVSMQSCGKSVQTGISELGLNMPACGADRLMRWHFSQNLAQELRKVDLLFVVDSSSSLAPERMKIAAQLPSFLSALPANTDYRVGVMLGHGGSSVWSGRLYAPTGTPRVLRSDTTAMATVQAQLQTILSHNVADRDEADGEALMYSVSRGLQPDRMAEARALGFYRDDAALSVVFISDENDICFRPELNGYSVFPDYVASYRNTEVTAFNRYCMKGDDVSVDIGSTRSALSAVQGGRGLSLAAITHVDPARVVKSGEDSLGHGILELVGGSSDGRLMDIGDDSWTSGLASLGAAVSRQLDLKTSFDLGDRLEILPDSVRAAVDGHEVPVQYDGGAGLLRISADHAGDSGSSIDVVACRQ